MRERERERERERQRQRERDRDREREVYNHSYCLIGDNVKLQYLRFCLLKCVLMWFL